VLIAVGIKVRDDLLAKRIGNTSKFEIINPGCELSKLPSRKTALHGLNLESKFRYIVWLGRIVKIKRPDRIIELARQLQHSHSDVRILVVGDGPLRKDTESTSRRENLPVVFTGWLVNVENVLAASEFMILTSDNEGTPVSLIQAQLAAIPAVATNVGSVSEIVVHDKSGFVAPINNFDKFIDYVKVLLNQPEYALKMGQNGQTRATVLFSVRKLVEEHERIYQKLLN
jgi:glycosyltransferase involved in cell wall biosynthesis